MSVPVCGSAIAVLLARLATGARSNGLPSRSSEVILGQLFSTRTSGARFTATVACALLIALGCAATLAAEPAKTPVAADLTSSAKELVALLAGG